jgi:transposase
LLLASIRVSSVNLDLTALPIDVDALHRLVRELATQAADDRTELTQARAEVERLRLIIQRLQRTQFGRRSERLGSDQLMLGFEDLDADIARAQAHSAVAVDDADLEPASRRQTLPDDLSREDITFDIDGHVCPCCGGALHAIGENVSEMLDFVPARLRVLRIRRPKYGCRGCGMIHQAPAPERPIAKGMASAGLLAHVLVSKYCDHTPLYRQTQILARHGVEIDRSTLSVVHAGGWSRCRRALPHMCSDRARCSPTTRRFRCSILAVATPRQAGCGSIHAMTDLGSVQIRRRPSTSTVPIARQSVLLLTSKDSAAFCRSTVMQASKG